MDWQDTAPYPFHTPILLLLVTIAAGGNLIQSFLPRAVFIFYIRN